MIKDMFAEQILQNLSFKPNTQQYELINLITDFILEAGNESLFLLKGYAGTGKTSVVSALVRTLTHLNQKCVLLAPTGRAAKVFSSYSGHQAFTIHKKIYRQKSFSADFDGFAINDNLHKNTLFIIDESSMISSSSDGGFFGSGRLLDDLMEYVYAGERCRIIFVGDTAQLPPVGQVSSPALDANVLKGYGMELYSYELTQVARQSSDSGILYNATYLRDMMSKGEPYDLPRLNVSEYPDVVSVSGYDVIESITSSYDSVGMEQTLIVTRSNMRANKFNEGVRNQILWREEELSAGDLLLISKNNYHWCKEIKGIDFIANGDMVEVKRVRRTQELYGFRFADVELIFPDYDVEVEAKIILDTLHSESPALSPEMNNRLFVSVFEDYADIRNQRDRIKRVKADTFFNALQVKYGYAVTCHKSQGGQWAHVYLDMGYINKEHLGLDFYRWLYTAFTRATEKIFLVNIADEFTA